MKILNLSIENIASLKGKHQIDFSKLSADNTTFAITGETGSGKSTILNSISLALYGQNYKSGLIQTDFVTLGEKEGLIELEFSLKENIYKAQWSCRVKKINGEDLKKPDFKSSFYQKTEEKWVVLESKPEDILNLNFDQFCKTIILNQGEFAKFLTSSFKDRKDILERFYDGQKLELLSFKTRQKITALNNEINIHESQILGLNETTSIDIESSKQELEVLKKDVLEVEIITKGLSATEKDFKDILNYKKDIRTNNDRLKTTNNDIKDLTATINTEKKNLDSKYKQVENKKSILEKEEPKLIKCIQTQDKINSMINESIALEKELFKIETNIEKSSMRKKELIDENNKLTNDLNNLKSEKNYTPLSEAEITQLRGLNTTYIAKKQALELISQSYTKQVKIIKELEEDGKKLKIKQEHLSQKLKEKALESIDTILKKKIELRDLFLQNKSKADHFLKFEMESSLEIVQLKAQHTDLFKKTEKMKDEWTECNERLNEINYSLKYFELLDAIGLCVHESFEKNQCVICDSTDRMDKISSKSSTNRNQDREELQSKLEIQIQKEALLKDEVSSNQLNLNNLQANIQKLEEKQQSQKKEIFTKFKLEEDSNLLDYLAHTDNTLKLEVESLREDQIQKSLIEKDILNLDSQLKILRDKYSKEINERDQLLSDKTANESNLVLLAESIKSINKKIEVNNIELILGLSTEALNLEKLSSANMKNIDQQKIILSDYQDQLQSKTKQKKDLETNTQSLKQELMKNIGDQNPLDILNSLKKDLKTIENDYQMAKSLLTSYEIKLAENTSKFKNFEEQIEASNNQIKILSISISDFAKKANTTIQTKDENFLRLLDEYLPFVKKLIDMSYFNSEDLDIMNNSYDLIKSLLQSFSDFYMENKEKLTRISTLIQEREKSLGKIIKIQEKVKLLTLNKNQLQDLYDLIGKDEFRNFVLSIIEKRLIIQTNHELKNLCDDRYKIVHFNKNSKMSPDFYVIDTFKGGLTRKVSTLSGGETFMVSLAMAIALSELTRGTSQIDSFFIDEGFGTLDEDSLEDVLLMINNIHSRGKTIGLITHVKKLADRIPFNIRLTKSELGNSSIKVLFH